MLLMQTYIKLESCVLIRDTCVDLRLQVILCEILLSHFPTFFCSIDYGKLKHTEEAYKEDQLHQVNVRRQLIAFKEKGFLEVQL